PVLFLAFLIFYAIFIQDGQFETTFINVFLIVATVFVTIYFNYFLITLSIKEMNIDAVTHSFNEKAFIKKLHYFKPKTLVLLSVNNLSSLGEYYPHTKIDLLLYTLIQELNHYLEKHGLQNQLIGRRHGSEFYIALHTDPSNIHVLLDTFTTKYANILDMDLDYNYTAISYSVGNNEKILQQLKDLKLSKRKEVHNPLPMQSSKELYHLESEVKHALEKRKFKLTFRPLIDTKENKTTIYEVITTLSARNDTEILARNFLPIINRLSLGAKYDLFLVEYIMELLPKVDSELSFAFNLSPYSLRDRDFQQKFFSLLSQNNIDNSRLIIKLYERKTHHDLSAYLQILNTYRDKGIRICIDNFGSSSSSSSMLYMKEFHFDMLQLDKDYTTKIDDHNYATVLQSLLAMAKDLQIVSIAKWVDTQEQKEKLTSLGVDYLQGFGIAKPIGYDTLLKQNHTKGLS
ncbi:MAG: EAL domain-containing protein, partial [Campylobacterota bacterium]|nr:EAL domain-containing protein [Campylobacterota bacterium]